MLLRIRAKQHPALFIGLLSWQAIAGEALTGMYVVDEDASLHTRILIHNLAHLLLARIEDADACDVAIIRDPAYNRQQASHAQLHIPTSVLPDDLSYPFHPYLWSSLQNNHAVWPALRQHLAHKFFCNLWHKLSLYSLNCKKNIALPKQHYTTRMLAETGSAVPGKLNLKARPLLERQYDTLSIKMLRRIANHGQSCSSLCRSGSFS